MFRSIFNAGLNFVSALALMLFLGLAHSTDPRVPNFGYFTCVFITLSVIWLVIIAIAQVEISKK